MTRFVKVGLTVVLSSAAVFFTFFFFVFVVVVALSLAATGIKAWYHCHLKFGLSALVKWRPVYMSEINICPHGHKRHGANERRWQNAVYSRVLLTTTDFKAYAKQVSYSDK